MDENDPKDWEGSYKAAKTAYAMFLALSGICFLLTAAVSEIGIIQLVAEHWATVGTLLFGETYLACYLAKKTNEEEDISRLDQVARDFYPRGMRRLELVCNLSLICFGLCLLSTSFEDMKEVFVGNLWSLVILVSGFAFLGVALLSHSAATTSRNFLKRQQNEDNLSSP